MTEAKKTTNLDELKNKLYEAFDKTIEKANGYFDRGYSEAGAELLTPALEAAKALAAVERELREAKQSGYGKLEKN